MGRTTRTDPAVLDRLVPDPAPLPNEYDRLKDVLAEARSTGDTQLLEAHVTREVQLARAEIVSGVMALIMDHPNPSLTAGCLAIAAGLPISEGRSLTDLARQHRISKEAVMQRVRILCKKLELPRPSERMKAMQRPPTPHYHEHDEEE